MGESEMCPALDQGHCSGRNLIFARTGFRSMYLTVAMR